MTSDTHESGLSRQLLPHGTVGQVRDGVGFTAEHLGRCILQWLRPREMPRVTVPVTDQTYRIERLSR